MNKARPIARSAIDGAFGKPATGVLGVRTALRTHSRSAVSAGTVFELPGNVTVTWSRLALGNAKALRPLGATLRSPPGPMSNPWFGSSALPLMATARGPGPD